MEKKNLIEENEDLMIDGIDNEDTINDDKDVKEKEPFNFKKEFFSWIMILGVAFLVSLLLSNFVIINANVPTRSMENTIPISEKGEENPTRMIGLRAAYWFSDPERGDIIIFKYPDDESQNYVKRIIGLPGDKVVIKDAKIYINDSEKPLKEDYLPNEWVQVNGSDEVLEYNVPEDSYFVLGDNRNVSLDARFWNNTYVKKDKIIAKAMFIYWPWEYKRILHSAKYD